MAVRAPILGACTGERKGGDEREREGKRRAAREKRGRGRGIQVWLQEVLGGQREQEVAQPRPGGLHAPISWDSTKKTRHNCK
jgi:hypothetical protein